MILNNPISFQGTMKITKGMTCYNKNFDENVVDELNGIGLTPARGGEDKFEGTPTLDTDNIKSINDMGIEYHLPDCDKDILLRFSNLKLKQADFDSFLLGYNSVKDNDVHIDINA